MATVMTERVTPASEAAGPRARAVLDGLDVELTNLAGSEGPRDGAAMISHDTPSPTRGERSIASAARWGQQRLNEALDRDASDRNRELAKIDHISQQVDRGKAAHPPLALSADPDLGLPRRFPGEMAAVGLVGGVEAYLLADPIQTTLNLASWKMSLVISSVVIALLVAASHLFADHWIRARDTTVPAARDSQRRVALGFAAIVALAGAMAVVSRVFNQMEVDGSAGGEWAAWAVFVIFQLVFVTANLALAVRDRDVRLSRWLAALRDRRMSLEADGSDEAISALRREFWTIVHRALCRYRNELQTANESGAFTSGWDNRTAADLRRRQLLRQVFPSAPVDPTPDFDQTDDEPVNEQEDEARGHGPRVAPEPPPEPAPVDDQPPTPAEVEEPLDRIRGAGPGDDTEEPVVDLTDEEPNGELEDLISQVLGEAGEDAA